MTVSQTILNVMWGGLGVYWLVSACRTKKTESGESSCLRVARLGLLTIVFVLLRSPWLRVGWLGRRFIPESRAVAVAGVVITAAGIVLCLWARRELGGNWSDKVVLKVDHELIRSGPYAFLRHPIYSGVLLAVAGTALATGEWKGALAFALMAVNYAIKARREERILAGRFAEAFEAYRKQAGFLLPWS